MPLGVPMRVFADKGSQHIPTPCTGGEDGIIEGKEEVSWHRFLPSSYHDVSCPIVNLKP